MNSKVKKLFLAIGMTFSLTSCFGPKVPGGSEEGEFTVNKEYIFGMTDLSYQEQGVNYEYTHKLFKNMGVKSIRLWMHCNWMMKNPNEYSSNLDTLKAIYNDIKDQGYQIIAMNHSNFHQNGLTNSASTTAKPPRDLNEGSSYLNWLNDLEQTYYMMAKAFPDIEYWEIDNECNNQDFMPRLGGGTFTLQEMAEIYYDMMYFASKGIHRASPNAKTVMGGIVVFNGPDTFLNTIYDLIEGPNSWSNNPDDYFQIACWHPYMSIFTKSRFINLNNSIYEVIKTREGKDKKVFLTECGFSETETLTPNKIGQYIKAMYEACRDDLYYVESMHYFRMYDEYSSTWGSDAEKYFGLFYDPVNEKVQKAGETKRSLAEPKESAYAYQEVAGGTGSLEVYENYLKGDYISKFVMHRGMSTRAKENTLQAFELAGQNANVEAIETDVYLTSDKKPVLVHDENIYNLTNHKIDLNVSTSTFEQVRNAKLPDIEGNPNVHQIPTLEEYLNVLSTYNKRGFLEFKKDFSSSDLDIILNEISTKFDTSKMMFISFYPGVLKLVREKLPNANISILYNSYADIDFNMCSQYKFGIDIEKGGVSDSNILELKQRGFTTTVWCVDNVNDARKYGQLGVDYITTNKLTSFN